MKRSGSKIKVPLRGTNTPRRSHFRVTVVGDSGCGKTSLVRSYTTDLTFPYTVRGSPSTPAQYPARGKLHGEEYSATISDASDVSFPDRRASLYGQADVIIVCFSLVDQSSFKSAKCKWLKEAQAHCPNTPVVLVGTKADMLHSPKIRQKDIVTTAQIGKLLVEHKQIHDYCESSALTKRGLDIVFDQVFQAAWIGPVRYVVRMKSVKPHRLSLGFLPNLFKQKKTVR